MRKLLPCFVALLFLMTTGWAAGPAGAGPAWKDNGGPPGHKKKDKDGYKKIPPGQLKKMLRYRKGGPPPWAPAHGYRRKAGKEVVVYAPPFGIAVGRCDREVLGRVLGGVAGGAIGASVGKGDERTVAVVAGTVVGVIVGGYIGRSLDRLDSACVGQILEHAPDGDPAMWRNPRTGAQYHVLPQRSYQTGDQEYCREYTATAIVGGREEQTYGMACRQPDGSWRLAS